MLLLLHGREARPASVAWNVAKTLLGTVVLWSLFFFAIPYLCSLADPLLGLNAYRLESLGWQITGGVLFVLGSILHLHANLMLALHGEGTPLYLDGPRKLVIRGVYRHLRNPMAVAGLAQAAGVALVLGSPLALAYAAALALAENFLVRPHEQADLERRFGDAYRRYRRRVSCWRPRLHGYDPSREAEEPILAAERTTPPGKHVVLYDGHCKFCTAQAHNLGRLVRPGSIALLNFQDPGVLDRFPGIPHEACMAAMHLVTADGRVYRGFEAAVRAVATRPVLGWPAYLYYLPGVRLMCDLLYRLLAAYRYRLLGRAVAAGECDGGTCALHVRPR